MLHLKEGGGPEGRKGQGRKPDLPDEQVRAATKRVQESGRFWSAPEAAVKCGACRGGRQVCHRHAQHLFAPNRPPIV